MIYLIISLIVLLLFLGTLVVKFRSERNVLKNGVIKLADEIKAIEEEYGYFEETTVMRNYDPLRLLRERIFVGVELIKKNRKELSNNYHEVRKTNVFLEEKYAQSYTLQLIQDQISHELKISELLSKAVDILVGVFGLQSCAVYTVNEQTSTLELQSVSQDDWYTNENRSIMLDSDHFFAKVFRDLKVYTNVDFKSHDTLGLSNEPSNIIVPLKAYNKCLGIMILENSLQKAVDKDLVDFVVMIANELSISLENAYLYNKMEQLANHDALTGVHNWMYMTNRSLEIFSDENMRQVSVAILDLDRFKLVNDKYGHLVGDIVLQNVAKLSQTMLSEYNLARYGGEEFVVILSNISPKEAYEKLDALRKVISDYRFLDDNGRVVRITVSIGVASHPGFPRSFKGLLRAADAALYQAKNSGRNRVCVADKETPLEVVEN